ncbi:MAG: hypothetical protein K6T66_07770 [Peptococcaceae bacterium]|nr:hypothetical protein [Peptococcaceae bacterium]
MSRHSPSLRRAIGAIVFILSAVLMIIRVDWWWWGHKVDPLVFGWLSYPMIYQIFIWLAGWGLVAVAVRYLWIDPGE